ncbi:MAG: hypothetical protein OXE56_08055 [Gammaproteobacteria bacterium]|nr:hypothetical protein [Gammaproteobacteria bacterium]
MIKSLQNEYGNRDRRNKTLIPLATILFLTFLITAFYNLATPPVELDDRLCPKKDGPKGATVLLLDTSDPLTPKHTEELRRLASQISSEDTTKPGGNAKNSLGIQPQELLAVYELSQNPGSPSELIEVCRPSKSPDNRDWRDDIRRGRRFYEREWESFEKELENIFPKTEGRPQPSSPILETITVLSARYASGKRGNSQFKTHLIVFSDLMQHTSRLSHYKTYPEAKVMRQFFPDLLTDLTDVSVSLFRLERPEYSKFQDENHYYWWTELVIEQGGKVVNQDTF